MTEAIGPSVDQPLSRLSRDDDETVVMQPYFADAPNRSIAYLLDASFLSLLVFVGAMIISLTFGPVVTFDLDADPVVQVDTGLALVDAALSVAISAVYFIATWRRFAGSPGQRLLSMRLLPEEGASISFRQAAVRWLFVGLPVGLEGFASVVLEGTADVLMLALVAIWYASLLVSIARHPRKQGWHDRLARTIVTKAGRPAFPDSSPSISGSRVR